MKLDRWLIAQCERLACEIESWTGFTQWQVARVCLLTQVAADAVVSMRESSPTRYAVFGLVLLGAGFVAGLTFLHESLQGRTGIANWMKHAWQMAMMRLCAPIALRDVAFVLPPGGLPAPGDDLHSHDHDLLVHNGV